MFIRLAVALMALAGLTAFQTLSAADSGTAKFAGRMELPHDTKFHGGFSAIEVAPDGIRFYAISDRGRIFTGLMQREQSQLRALQLQPTAVLANAKGKRIAGKANDAEGIALSQDRLYVSFEGDHRVQVYDSPDGPAQRLPGLPEFAKMEENGGFEALAADTDGNLYVLPERKWWHEGGWPVYRFGPGGWVSLPGYRQNDGFLPVGPEIGPDGRLYILERHFRGLGFSSRVTSYTVDSKGLHDPRVILSTRALRFGNLEGLSVWRDENGQIRLTMIADDNFMPFQRSEIVEYTLPEHPRTAALRD